METIYTEQDLVAIRKEYASDATDEQFQNFLRECKIRNAIPGKHIYFQKRAKWVYDATINQYVKILGAVHLTSIDFFRIIAQRSGEYQGQDPADYIYLDESKNPSIHSEVPLPNKQIYAVAVSVYRKGFIKPKKAVARFDAYAVSNKKGELTEMWEKRGPEQLSKCSEALALRQAFPEDLSGLYISEEFDKDDLQSTPQQPAPVSKISEQQSIQEFIESATPTDEEIKVNVEAQKELFPTKEKKAVYATRLKRFSQSILPQAGIKNAREVLGKFLQKHVGKEDMKNFTINDWEKVLETLEKSENIVELVKSVI